MDVQILFLDNILSFYVLTLILIAAILLLGMADIPCISLTGADPMLHTPTTPDKKPVTLQSFHNNGRNLAAGNNTVSICTVYYFSKYSI